MTLGAYHWFFSFPFTTGPNQVLTYSTYFWLSKMDHSAVQLNEQKNKKEKKKDFITTVSK